MLWTWFEEDDILQDALQRPRLHTDSNGYFLHDDLWNLLIHRLSLEYAKWRQEGGTGTAIIEFSRGVAHGGYISAYGHISDQILSSCSSLYVNVSYDESLRKNRARFNPDRPFSILEHGLSDEKLERLYRHDDWMRFTHSDPAYISETTVFHMWFLKTKTM